MRLRGTGKVWIACLGLGWAGAGLAKGGTDIDGRLRVGFSAKGLRKGEAETDAKLEIKTKRQDGARAVLDLRGSSLDREVIVKEAYFEKEWDDDAELVLGLAKKILGLEYDVGSEDRLPILRSVIYQKLETFAYVGRELNLRYTQKTGAGDRWGYTVALGYADSQDINVNGGIDVPLGGDFHLSNWTLIQADRISGKRQLVWTDVLSLWSRTDDLVIEWELVGGIDPFESEFEKTYGSGRDVAFYGTKLHYGVRYGLSDTTALVPFFLTSFVVHDSRISGYNTIEAMLGVNYHVGKDLRLGLDLDMVATNSRVDYATRAYDESRASMELAYFF